MTSESQYSFEIVRLIEGYGVARINLEIEATFETKDAARAYIVCATKDLSPDPYKLASAVDELMLRIKGKRFARLINFALSNDWISPGRDSILNKKYFALEVSKCDERYLLSELQKLSQQERGALSTLEILDALLDWLVYIGCLKNRSVMTSIWNSVDKPDTP